MKSEALPALLALVVPTLFLWAGFLGGPEGIALQGAGWLCSCVLLGELLPEREANC